MDNIFRTPRIWSNSELKKFAPLFDGHVVNVSGWKDQDKQGKKYRSYFQNASAYSITNFKAEARGYQGKPGEIFLNLEEDLDKDLNEKFDVVFNHTVLEHIYNCQKAFRNLCKMSKDVVIIVVPFLQKMHADYGDYWRFTPLTIKRMYEENGMKLQYLSFNSHDFSSVYIFAIGVKNEKKWADKIDPTFSFEDPKQLTKSENFIGVHGIQSPSLKNLIKYFRLYLKSKFSI